MENTINSNDGPTQEEIAACAFRIYEEEGCVPGHELEHWLRAEERLLQERQKAAGKKKQRKAVESAASGF